MSSIYSKTTGRLKKDLSLYLFVDSLSDDTYSLPFIKLKIRWLRGKKIYDSLCPTDKTYLDTLLAK
jgi:hypothetical protein